MNKILFFFCLLTFSIFAQDEVSKEHARFRKEHSYGQSRNYKGPKNDNWSSPVDMQDNTPYNGGQANQGLPISRSALKSGRPSYPSGGAKGSGGSGNTQQDPDIQEAEPFEDPDYDMDIDPDPPKSNFSISDTFWKVLLIILGLVIVALIIYFILQRKAGETVRTVPFEPLEENMNPVTISKTELELRLEAAELEENYKECVRIYFLFAMKELIEKKAIFWKKEKTNMHYIIEMSGKAGSSSFNEIVKWYDLVWYGDYTIDKIAYSKLSPLLESAYKSLNTKA